MDAARNATIKRAEGASLELKAQPEFLSAGKLRDYQLEGLNWMMYAWLKVCRAVWRMVCARAFLENWGHSVAAHNAAVITTPQS